MIIKASKKPDNSKRPIQSLQISRESSKMNVGIKTKRSIKDVQFIEKNKKGLNFNIIKPQNRYISPKNGDKPNNKNSGSKNSKKMMVW